MSNKEFDQFTKVFADFTSSISLLNIFSNLNLATYENFPEDLPTETKLDLKSKLKDAASTLVDSIFEEAPNDSNKINKIEFAMSGLNLIAEEDYDKIGPKFQQLILRQNLIYYVALIEGLFQDVFRLILKKKPEYISEDKELKWGEIAGFNSKDEIVDYMIEKHLLKSGYVKLTKQIQIFNTPPFKFGIKIKKNSISSIDNLLLIRNMIVHNNTKKSKDYILYNAEPKELHGEQFILKSEYLSEVHMMARIISGEMYAAIGGSLFGKSEESLYSELAYSPDIYKI